MTTTSAKAYATWLSELEAILKGQRGAPTLEQLSGEELHAAFTEGVTPREFAAAPRCYVWCTAPPIDADPERQRISEITLLRAPSLKGLWYLAVGVSAFLGIAAVFAAFR
jgi:hypothetical protein